MDKITVTRDELRKNIQNHLAKQVVEFHAGKDKDEVWAHLILQRQRITEEAETFTNMFFDACTLNTPPTP